MQVYVLLYNVGTANEGIHTIDIGGKNMVLMFESEDDATRYGILLEAQDFLTPSVEKINSEEIEEFCQQAGYENKLVTEGMLEIPPEKNIDSTNWNEEAKYSTTESNTDMSSAELDRIRRQLEGLL
jgi:Protein of unknown function (DUF3110)